MHRGCARENMHAAGSLVLQTSAGVAITAAPVRVNLSRLQYSEV